MSWCVCVYKHQYAYLHIVKMFLTLQCPNLEFFYFTIL